VEVGKVAGGKKGGRFGMRKGGRVGVKKDEGIRVGKRRKGQGLRGEEDGRVRGW
jgi:hypothetical protein